MALTQHKDQVQATAVNRLNYPAPCVTAGMALRGIARSAIDISDGLIADLGHISDGSQVGVHITLEELPLSKLM